jgi:hypothetical protein
MTAIAASGTAATMRRGGEAQVVLALARVEAARLIRHPVVMIGAALSVAFALSFAPEAEIGGSYLLLIGPALLPLALATLVASNLAALRSRRSRTGDLEQSLAVDRPTRTLALLLALGGPALLAIALVAAGFTWFGGWDGLVVEPDGTTATPRPAELAQGPLVVVACGIIGVALARWIRFPVGAVAAVALLVLQMPFVMWNLQEAPGWLLPLVNPQRLSPGVDSSWPCSLGQSWPCEFGHLAPLEWHLTYLVGVGALLAGLALLRDDRRPSHRLVAVAGLLLAAVAGIAQLP